MNGAAAVRIGRFYRDKSVWAGLLSLLLVCCTEQFVSAEQRRIISDEAIVSIETTRAQRRSVLEQLLNGFANDAFEAEKLSPFAFRVKNRNKAYRRASYSAPEIHADDAATISYRRSYLACNSPRVKRYLRRCGGRCACSPNYIVTADVEPNDPYFFNTWGLHNSGDVDINAPAAWDITTGSRAVAVGVIDTGILTSHPDLSANIWTNPDEIPENGLDDDGNGYIDDIHGINAITNSGLLIDDHGHGTHVAGTIGAEGDNGRGLPGVSWAVTLIGAKFLSANGSGSTANAVKCVDYLTALKLLKGIDIVASNNSWGGGGYSIALHQAIQRAHAAGILFVAAAGNNGRDNDAIPRYPTGYDVDNIISVASLQKAGTLSSFSNYGATSVDIAAPGSAIVSSYLNNNYASLSGTSMAAPHVSGLLALMRSVDGVSTHTELRNRLFMTVRTLDALAGKVSTGGVADAHAALLSIVGTPTATPTATSTHTPTPAPTEVPVMVTPEPTEPVVPSPSPTPESTYTPYLPSTPTAPPVATDTPNYPFELQVRAVNGREMVVPRQIASIAASVPVGRATKLVAALGGRLCVLRPLDHGQQDLQLRIPAELRHFRRMDWAIIEEYQVMASVRTRVAGYRPLRDKEDAAVAARRACQALRTERSTRNRRHTRAD
ncbi:MAG: S8 family peptidase [Bdellovibrionota bacterium]|nr:MAG: S8 family peptidase [Bdellovibrionota bacterium]